MQIKGTSVVNKSHLKDKGKKPPRSVVNAIHTTTICQKRMTAKKGDCGKKKNFRRRAVVGDIVNRLVKEWSPPKYLQREKERIGWLIIKKNQSSVQDGQGVAQGGKTIVAQLENRRRGMLGPSDNEKEEPTCYQASRE